MSEHVTGEVINLPVPISAPGETYRPALALTAVEAKQLTMQVREITKAALVEGIDYATIPGCGPKPTLHKPGAEHLLQFFGYGHDMGEPLIDRDDANKPVGVMVKCTVTKSLPDREVTVASCYGYASLDEPKWKKAPFNTVLKMAEKRALVGAALQACAASQLFTQDLDDDPPERSARGAPPPPAPAGEPLALPDEFAMLAIRNKWKELDPGIRQAINEGWQGWGSIVPNTDNPLLAEHYDDAWSFVQKTAQETYDRRRKHIMVKLGEAGIRSEDARHLLVSQATGGQTESTSKLTDVQHKAVIEAIEALIASDEEG